MQSTRRNFLLAAAGGRLGAAAAAAGEGRLPVQAADHAGELTVPERKMPVLAEVDVVVCGGDTGRRWFCWNVGRA